jgi:hypothetical protein
MAASRHRDYIVGKARWAPSAPVRQISLLLRRVSRPERCCARGCSFSPGWAPDLYAASRFQYLDCFREGYGSTVYLVADGAKREFHYDQPRPGMLDAGAQPGSLLFTGRVVGGRYFGTAYIFSPECGQMPYEVSGPILDNYEKGVLKGQAPRLDTNCRLVGYYTGVLEFSRLKPARTTSSARESYAYAPLPAARLSSEFTGVWILANDENNQCRRTDWKGVAASANDRLVSITPRQIEMWEDGCTVIAVKPVRSQFHGGMTVSVNLACGGEGMTWRSYEVWHVQTINGFRQW